MPNGLAVAWRITRSGPPAGTSGSASGVSRKTIRTPISTPRAAMPIPSLITSPHIPETPSDVRRDLRDLERIRRWRPQIEIREQLVLLFDRLVPGDDIRLCGFGHQVVGPRTDRVPRILLGDNVL